MDLSQSDSNTTLLFLDTLDHPCQCFNIDEIIFKTPVVLQLIRILPPEFSPHPSLDFQSATQIVPIKDFEVFAKNLKNSSDRFETILEATIVNDKAEIDGLIPLSKELKTDHLIIRGEYEKVSIAIYGEILSHDEFGIVISKQFDGPLQVKKEEITPLLSYEEEKILSDAKSEVIQNVDSYAITLQKKMVIMEVQDELMGKAEAQAKSILDIYKFIVPNPSSTVFCGMFQDLITTIELLLERQGILPKKRFGQSIKDLLVTLPECLPSICINGLKGEFNGLAEASLSLGLIKFLSVSNTCVHNLLALGILQCLADIMSNCKSTELRAKTLEAINSLINQSEFLEAMQNQKLSIKAEPEILYIKKSSKTKSNNDNKEKYSRKEKRHKHSKSHHKRQRSISQDISSNKGSSEKRKKIIMSSISEIIESDFGISTLYLLIISFILAKQSSIIIQLVKSILRKIDLIENLKVVNMKDKDKKGMLVFSIEIIYEYINSEDVITNELGQLLDHYGCIESLMNILENCISEDNTCMILAIARIFKLLILKNGVSFLESKNIHKTLLELCYTKSNNHDLFGIRKDTIDLNEFQLFHMLKKTNRINYETLLKNFFKLPDLEQWIKRYLLKSEEKEIPVKYLLVKQIRNELAQVIVKKDSVEVLRRVFFLMQKEIITEAVADVIWSDNTLPELFESVKENLDGLLILLHILLTLIKQEYADYTHIDFLIDSIKTIHEKIQSKDLPTHLITNLNSTIETFLSLIEVNVKPHEFPDLVKTLWTNLPTFNSSNAFHDANFLRQLFVAACNLPSNISPFFLGCSEINGAPIVLYKSVYRRLTSMMENPGTLIQVFDSGLLSHLRHLFLTLSSCIKQWSLPAIKRSQQSQTIISEDYLELILHMLKFSKKAIRKFVISGKSYHDSIMIEALIDILSYVLRHTIVNKQMKVSITKEITGIFAAWFRQVKFIDEIFLPKILELLFDIPNKRFTALYLLMFAACNLNVMQQNSLLSLQTILLSQGNYAEGSVARIQISRYGSILGWILNTLYESHDSRYISMGISTLKLLINIFSYDFSEYLLKEFTTTFSSYIIPIGQLEVSTKLLQDLSKRLLIFHELIPTTFKFSIITSTLLDNFISMIHSLNQITTNKEDCAEIWLLKNIKELCIPNQELLNEQITIYELTPSIPKLKRVLDLLSHRTFISPPIFTALSHGSSIETLLILNYLETIKSIAGTFLGKSIILFGEHNEDIPLEPKVTICFKELIDQCYELAHLNVSLEILSPIISYILDIALVLTQKFDESGLKHVEVEDNEIPTVIIKGVVCILAENLQSVSKLNEKLKDFLVYSEVSTKWEKLMQIFSHLNEYVPLTSFKVSKVRPLDQIYKSYNNETLLQNKLSSLLMPKTIKYVENVYLMKHRGVLKESNTTLFGDIMKLKYFDSHSDDWILERLLLLEHSITSYFSDIDYILTDLNSKIIKYIGQISNLEQLQVMNENLLISMQTLKRKQREEIEKRRNLRLKPTTLKYQQITPAVTQRKSIVQPLSRTISTHVDEFEGIDKGTKNPFPQLQRTPNSKTSLETPYIITTSPQKVEDKSAITSKYKDVITLLNCLPKSPRLIPSETRPSIPPPFIGESTGSLKDLASRFVQGTELNEEEKGVCKMIMQMKEHRAHDPRTQERISRLIRQYPKIGPYVIGNLKKA